MIPLIVAASYGQLWGSASFFSSCGEVYDFLQHGRIHIFQFVDIKATLACGVLPQFFQQSQLPGCLVDDIQGEVLFARREADPEPVQFAAALVGEMYVSETDDCRAPHFSLIAGGAFHHLENGETVFPLLHILHRA